MQFIVAIPGLIALFYARKYGAAAAFLNVYLPVLLLLPDYYRWVLPALPDPTFGEAVIIPIFAVFILKTKWRFSITDFLVFGYLAAMTYSEFINAGYADAQNLSFDLLGNVVFPYMLAKGLIEPRNLGVTFARKIVILLFWISVISVYEFRFGTTPWQQIMNPFFPGQGLGWVTTFRYGFARIAGPYGHAILAGLILIIGYRLQRWLQWKGAWEASFRSVPWLPMSKTTIITLGLLAGIIMTMVRGPWMGGLAAGVFTWMGRSKHRKAALLAFLAGIPLVAVPLGVTMYNYASVGRANAKSVSQETAAYRKELLDKYIAIVQEHALWGWGTNDWPRVPGMPSIDNYYLLLSLMHGVISMGLMVAILLSMVVRLIIRGMTTPPPIVRGASLAFTLAAVHVAIFITIGTVYMGAQVIAIWALMTGWSEGYLLAGKKAFRETQGNERISAPVTLRRFEFERVVT